MTRSIQEIRADYERRGFDAPKSAVEAMLLRKELIADPAYWDAKHPRHEHLQADVAMMYAITTPRDE